MRRIAMKRPTIAAADEGAERQQQGPGDRLEEKEELRGSEAAPHRYLTPPGRAGTRPNRWRSRPALKPSAIAR